MSKRPVIIRFLATMMLLLVTLSSNGVFLSAHFCQGSVTTFSIYTKAKGCDQCDITKFESEESCNEVSLDKKKCCRNSYLFAKVNPVTDTLSYNPTELNLADFDNYEDLYLELSDNRTHAWTVESWKIRGKSSTPLYIVLGQFLV